MQVQTSKRRTKIRTGKKRTRGRKGNRRAHYLRLKFIKKFNKVVRKAKVSKAFVVWALEMNYLDYVNIVLEKQTVTAEVMAKLNNIASLKPCFIRTSFKYYKGNLKVS